MDSLPREKLAEILTQYGRSVCDDPRRCEALLKDLCGQNKREISALMGALKERVPAELLAAEAGLPKPALIARLAGRLSTDLAFTEEAARWAVESWALALGVVTTSEIEAARPIPAPAPLPPPTPVNARPAPPAPVPNRGPVNNWPPPSPRPIPPPAPPPDPVGQGVTVLRTLGGLFLAAIGLYFFGLKIYRLIHLGEMHPVSSDTSIPRVNAPPYTPLGSPWKPAAQSPGQQPLQAFEASGSLYALALSPDDHTMAAANGKHLELWDATTKTRLHDIAAHAKKLYAVTFSPDGKTVATGAEDSRIKLWDAQTGSLLRTLKPPTSTVYATDIGMNGVTHSVYQEESKAGRALAFNHDGSILATDGGNAGTILLWDTRTGRLKRKTEAHTMFHALHFSPDDSLLAGMDGNDKAQVWDARSMRKLRVIDSGGSQGAYAFAPDGETLALAPESGSGIKIWSLKTGKMLRAIKTDFAWMRMLAFLPDGKSLVGGGEDGLRLIDAQTGKTIRQYGGGPATPRQAALSPDGALVAVAGNKDKYTVNLYSDEGGKTIGVWKTQP